jgi:hypothetical protein
LRNVDAEAIPEVSSEHNLVRKVKRARRIMTPAEPLTLIDWQLEDEFKTTLDGSDFFREVQLDG